MANAKEEREKAQKKEKLTCLDGEEQFESMYLDFFFLTEMYTLDSPKFSAQFENSG